MRLLSVSSLIVLVTTLIIAPTTASAAGWCLRLYDQSGAAGTLCRFQTFEQCLASRNSFVETCIVDLQSPPPPRGNKATSKKR